MNFIKKILNMKEVKQFDEISGSCEDKLDEVPNILNNVDEIMRGKAKSVSNNNLESMGYYSRIKDLLAIYSELECVEHNLEDDIDALEEINFEENLNEFNKGIDNYIMKFNDSLDRIKRRKNYVFRRIENSFKREYENKILKKDCEIDFPYIR